jgi:hypothetical protein
MFLKKRIVVLLRFLEEAEERAVSVDAASITDKFDVSAVVSKANATITAAAATVVAFVSEPRALSIDSPAESLPTILASVVCSSESVSMLESDIVASCPHELTSTDDGVHLAPSCATSSPQPFISHSSSSATIEPAEPSAYIIPLPLYHDLFAGESPVLLFLS